MTAQGGGSLDIPALVEKIRGHRFDGYTHNQLADEIEKFRSGPGIKGIGDAVDALQAVAGALHDTDDTLRRELNKLGVHWQSQAGGRASTVLTEQAGFSQDAKQKLSNSAQMIFDQGAAFNDTKNKLPDSNAVRAGADPLTIRDQLLGLLGFETDHVRGIKESIEARSQTVQALNSYAQTSGDNLAGTESVEQPEGMRFNSAPDGQSPTDIGTSAVDIKQQTHAAHASMTLPLSQPDAPVTGTPVSYQHSSGSSPDYAAPAASYRPSGQSESGPRTGSGSGVSGSAPRPTIPSSTAPAASAPAAPPAPVGGVVGGGPRTGSGSGQPEPSRPGSPVGGGVPGGTGATTPGTPGGTGPGTGGVIGGGVPGSGSGSTERPGGALGKPGLSGSGLSSAPGSTGTGTPGGSGSGGTSTGSPGSSGGNSGVAARLGGASGLEGGLGGGKAGATGGGEQTLGKGKVMGAAPQTGAGGVADVGRGFAASPRPGGAGTDLGMGAAAMGAGGVGGALSGEEERRGRGVGRGGVGGRGERLPIGELPEEEESRLRGSERLSNRAGKPTASFLERAATQHGEDEEDAEHVRRYGIDDKDLFTDQRRVSPDLIGDPDADDVR